MMNDPADQATYQDAGDRLNDTSNYQRCFGCGARNLAGLRLRFHAEGDTIVTEYTPEAAFQGFPGVVHGGILATLLDETLSRTATAEGRWMMTGRLDIRFRRPAPLGRTLRVTARPVSSRARAIQATGEIRLADEPDMVIATAEGTFLPLTTHYREQAAQEFPEIADFFEI